MAIVERACAALGHPLGLTSTVGRGTRFMLQLWLSDAAADVQHAHPTPEALPLSTTDRIALLVENDTDLRRAMALLLEKWGVSVLEAANSPEAQELIEEIGIAPDVLLVDQDLGEGDPGLELIAQMRRQYGALPAALITATRASDLAPACAAADVALFLKPIDSTALRHWMLSQMA